LELHIVNKKDLIHNKDGVFLFVDNESYSDDHFNLRDYTDTIECSKYVYKHLLEIDASLKNAKIIESVYNQNYIHIFPTFWMGQGGNEYTNILQLKYAISKIINAHSIDKITCYNFKFNSLIIRVALDYSIKYNITPGKKILHFKFVLKIIFASFEAIIKSAYKYILFKNKLYLNCDQNKLNTLIYYPNSHYKKTFTSYKYLMKGKYGVLCDYQNRQLFNANDNSCINLKYIHKFGLDYVTKVIYGTIYLLNNISTNVRRLEKIGYETLLMQCVHKYNLKVLELQMQTKHYVYNFKNKNIRYIIVNSYDNIATIALMNAAEKLNIVSCFIQRGVINVDKLENSIQIAKYNVFPSKYSLRCRLKWNCDPLRSMTFGNFMYESHGIKNNRSNSVKKRDNEKHKYIIFFSTVQHLHYDIKEHLKYLRYIKSEMNKYGANINYILKLHPMANFFKYSKYMNILPRNITILRNKFNIGNYDI
jgi:hypothetical protein